MKKKRPRSVTSGPFDILTKLERAQCKRMQGNEFGADCQSDTTEQHSGGRSWCFDDLWDRGIRAVPSRPYVKRPGRLDNGKWKNLSWKLAQTRRPKPHVCAQWDGWLQDDPTAGIGILTGKHVAIDIDCDDAALAERAYELAVSECGPTSFVRTREGSPRRILVYRAAKPGKKITTHKFLVRGVECRVEILQQGQFFVADGPHSPTARYAWVGRNLLDADWREPPEVTQEQLLRLREAINLEASVLHDGVRIAKASEAQSDEFGEPITPDLEGLRDKRGITRELVSEWIPNDTDWDGMRDMGFAIKRAVSHEPEEGFKIFDDWCRGNGIYWDGFEGLSGPEYSRRFWDGLDITAPCSNPLGIAYIEWRARQNGWKDLDGLEPVDDDDYEADDASEDPFEPKVDLPEFQIEEWDDIKPNTTGVHLIYGVLLRTGTATVIGASESRKSQIVMNMAVAIADGAKWCNRQTMKGAVVYVSGEGIAGVRRRIAGIRQAQQTPPGLPIWPILQPLNVTKPKVVTGLIESIKKKQRAKGVPLRLVIFDTLTSITGGMDHDKSKDMSAYVEMMKTVSRELDCLSLTIHHTGRDETKGGRGSTALIGDVDTELRVKDLKTGRSEVWDHKQRDLEKGMRERFVQCSALLGRDEYGNPISAGYVRWEDDPATDFPEPLDPGAIDEILRRMDDWGGCRKDVRAKRWIGQVIGDVLRFDPKTDHGKTRVERVVRQLLDSAAVQEVSGEDEYRKPKVFYHTTEWVSENAAVH